MALATHRGLGILVGTRSQQGLHHPGMASYAGPDEDRAASLRTRCSNSITSILNSLMHMNPIRPPSPNGHITHLALGLFVCTSRKRRIGFVEVALQAGIPELPCRCSGGHRD